MAPEIRRGDLYGPEVDWWSVGCVVYEMMLGMFRDSYDCVCREQFPTYVTHAAVSILRDFLQRDPRRRLGARGDTRSILRHPFFKNINCEAVLQKRVTPPVKPPTLEFLNIHPDAPGHGDDVGRNPSIENRHEAILEAPLHQDAQLVLEATINREAPVLLEAPLVRQGHLEDMKETEDSPEEEKKEESVQETFHGEIELLEAVTVSNHSMYYRDILCMICFCFVLWQCLVWIIYINIFQLY